MAMEKWPSDGKGDVIGSNSPEAITKETWNDRVLTAEEIKVNNLNRRYTFIVKDSVQTASWPPDEFISIKNARKMSVESRNLDVQNENESETENSNEVCNNEVNLDEIKVQNIDENNENVKKKFNCCRSCCLQ